MDAYASVYLAGVPGKTSNKKLDHQILLSLDAASHASIEEAAASAGVTPQILLRRMVEAMIACRNRYSRMPLDMVVYAGSEEIMRQIAAEVARQFRSPDPEKGRLFYRDPTEGAPFSVNEDSVSDRQDARFIKSAAARRLRGKSAATGPAAAAPKRGA